MQPINPKIGHYTQLNEGCGGAVLLPTQELLGTTASDAISLHIRLFLKETIIKEVSLVFAEKFFFRFLDYIENQKLNKDRL